MTHSNAALIETLFNALSQHQPDTMAACYAPNATFQDIAFRLQNRGEIHGMWRMICLGGSEISATFKIVEVDDEKACVRLVDRYKFGEDGHRRPVVNVIESHFVFDKGLIVEHRDDCDPKAWADAAMGGIKGFIAGRVGFIRRYMAGKKLEKWLREHPASAN